MKFLKNIFDIAFRPYYWRQYREYGNCDQLGFAYTRKIYNKDIAENIRVLNFENYPSLDSLFYNNNETISEDYFILINFDKNNTTHLNTLKNFRYSINYYLKIKKFQIIDNEMGCYLIKRK
tara:strand:+ start:161 stop:523 length:363 start_codon:yes stop_codon:yes gene_type:complete